MITTWDGLFSEELAGKISGIFGRIPLIQAKMYGQGLPLPCASLAPRVSALRVLALRVPALRAPCPTSLCSVSSCPARPCPARPLPHESLLCESLALITPAHPAVCARIAPLCHLSLISISLPIHSTNLTFALLEGTPALKKSLQFAPMKLAPSLSSMSPTSPSPTHS